MVKPPSRGRQRGNRKRTAQVITGTMGSKEKQFHPFISMKKKSLVAIPTSNNLCQWKGYRILAKVFMERDGNWILQDGIFLALLADWERAPRE